MTMEDDSKSSHKSRSIKLQLILEDSQSKECISSLSTKEEMDKIASNRLRLCLEDTQEESPSSTKKNSVLEIDPSNDNSEDENKDNFEEDVNIEMTQVLNYEELCDNEKENVDSFELGDSPEYSKNDEGIISRSKEILQIESNLHSSESSRKQTNEIPLKNENNFKIKSPPAQACLNRRPKTPKSNKKDSMDHVFDYVDKEEEIKNINESSNTKRMLYVEDTESQEMSAPNLTEIASSVIAAVNSSILNSNASNRRIEDSKDPDELLEYQVTKNKVEIEKNSVAENFVVGRQTNTTSKSEIFSTPTNRRKRNADRTPQIQKSKSSKKSKRLVNKLLAESPSPYNHLYKSRRQRLFDKKYFFAFTGFRGAALEFTEKQLKGYGGVIINSVESFFDEDLMAIDNTIVIATPESTRTKKFLVALALGIPTLHADWLTECFKERKLLTFEGFRVPAGLSCITQKYECPPVERSCVFKNVCIGIADDNSTSASKDTRDDFHDMFAMVIKLCGGTVIKKLSKKHLKDVDVVMTRSYTYICEVARQKKIAIVSEEWIYECILMQRKVDPSNEKFAVYGGKLESKKSGLLTELTHAFRLQDPLRKYVVNDFVFYSTKKMRHSEEKQIGQIKKIQTKDSSSSLKTWYLQLFIRDNLEQRLTPTNEVIKVHDMDIKAKLIVLSYHDYSRLKYNDPLIFYAEESLGQELNFD